MQGPILSIKPGTITDHLTVSFCQLNEVFNYYTYAFDTGIVACASVCVCVCVYIICGVGEREEGRYIVIMSSGSQTLMAAQGRGSGGKSCLEVS